MVFGSMKHKFHALVWHFVPIVDGYANKMDRLNMSVLWVEGVLCSDEIQNVMA